MAANPKRYRELSEPLPSREAADAFANGFFKDLDELRVKHKMRDVLVVVSGSYLDGEEEIEFALPMAIGDQSKAYTLAAYAYGYLRSEHEEQIVQLLMKARKKREG
jgi:hypothetical protein